MVTLGMTGKDSVDMSDEECQRPGRSDMYIQHTIAPYTLLCHLRGKMYRRLAILRIERELLVLQAVDNPQVGERKALTRAGDGKSRPARQGCRRAKSRRRRRACATGRTVPWANDVRWK